MRLFAGVDIGGTKTAAALVTPDGRVLARQKVATPAHEGPGAILDAAAAAVTGFGTPVAAVGVGSAGVIDSAAGTVLAATDALPGWAGTRLRDGLRRRLGDAPVAVDNDVHAHLVGEAWRGAAVGYRQVLLVAVGTGIGGSMLLDGRIHHGAHHVAGHAGHMPVPAASGRPCGCGGHGHAEAVAAGPALPAAYLERGGAPVADGLATVSARADDGDQLAAAVLAEGATALGQVIAGLVSMLDPELVVVVGGVSNCGPSWWEPLRATVATETLPRLADVPLVRGTLGGEAAVIGAARLGAAAFDAGRGGGPVPGAQPLPQPLPQSATQAGGVR